MWPVANHAIRRPLRVWSLDGGPDLAALDALAHGEADALRVPDPPPAHLRAQLAAELAASRTHLRAVEAAYWDDDWRSVNRGYGIYPEHHLWDAVTATSICSMRRLPIPGTTMIRSLARWRNYGSRSRR